MASERVIVIGAGGISNAWFPPIQAEHLNVVAVVDLRPEAAAAQVEKYQLSGATVSSDIDKTLSDFSGKADFVIDLTIPAAHCDVTCRALRSGFHVVGEKPMAENIEQARRMVRTSEETGKLYMVSQSRRWESRHATLAGAVRGHAVGDLSTLNCDFFMGCHFGGFRDEMASPLILDMAIHHFDLARFFSGTDAISVYAEEFNPKGSWYKGDVSANCLFEMTDGVRFAYRGSWAAEGCHTSWNGDWRVIGSRGTLVYDHDQPPRGQVVCGDTGFNRPLADAIVNPVVVEKGGMHGALAEMLRFLRTGEKPQTECHDNINSLAMVLGAIESAKTGRRVKLSELA